MKVERNRSVNGRFLRMFKYRCEERKREDEESKKSEVLYKRRKGRLKKRVKERRKQNGNTM